MKINKLFMAFLVLMSVTFSAQTGYIYVHKKASSEDSSVNFPFELKQGATSIKTFNLNDKPDALNAFDLGNSHGTGEGQLWAIINNGSTSGSTHDVTGTLYTRASSSEQWVSTGVTTARSVDGIGLNSAVYSDANGNVFLYNSGTSTQIRNTSNVIDVASGGPGGIIVAVTNGGALLRYSGSGTTWTTLAGTNVSNVYRVDVNPTPVDQEIVFLRTSDQDVYRRSGIAASSNATSISAPTGSSNVGNNLRDIAVSNEGTIFANYNNAAGEGNVFEYTTSWVDNSKSRGLSGLTAGIGNQAWGITKVNVTQGIKHTIYARAVPGTTGNPAVADWLDDERVRVTSTNAPYGNSIMIPVSAGTYTLKEGTTANWNNSNISLYDPTNNSSADLATSTATIIVAAGEVVNVVYSNAKQNSVLVPAVCGTNYVVDFGKGTNPYGPAFDGFTSYHYRYAGIVGDTYYSVVKNSSEWYGGQNLTLKNHTPTNPLLPGDAITNPPDPNGYFGMFNASYATDDFFRQTVTGLSIGTVYEFAFWVADLSPNAPIRPQFTMGITNPATGIVINSSTPAPISNSNWVQYKFNFTATSTVGEIFLKNNSIGGSGNDLAIDDITFAPAPPLLGLSTGPVGVTLLCSNPSASYQFSNLQTGGTWSTDTPLLISINPTSGLVTTVTGAIGTANIIYTFSSSSGCSSSTALAISVGNCACYNDASTGFGEPTNHGISLLKRAGADNGGWPMNRKSALTALESNSKGFVITRMTTAQILAIAFPQEGMMVYDTNAKCLKINTTGTNSGWSCFNIPACP